MKREMKAYGSGAQNEIDKELYDKLLMYCIIPRSTREICEFLNLSSLTYTRERYIKPLISSNKLTYTNKISKNARNQKYITVNKLL